MLNLAGQRAHLLIVVCSLIVISAGTAVVRVEAALVGGLLRAEGARVRLVLGAHAASTIVIMPAMELIITMVVVVTAPAEASSAS